MRLLRGLAATVLWIVAAVLGLVAVLLCVTIILLPVGLPLLNLARKLFGQATRLMLPRALAHPVDEAHGRMRKRAKDVAPDKKTPQRLSKKAKKTKKRARKLVPR